MTQTQNPFDVIDSVLFPVATLIIEVMGYAETPEQYLSVSTAQIKIPGGNNGNGGGGIDVMTTSQASTYVAADGDCWQGPDDHTDGLYTFYGFC